MDMTVTVKIHVPDDGLGYIDTANRVPSKTECRRIIRDAILAHASAIPMLEDAEATITIK
jgi:hypothetical protein